MIARNLNVLLIASVVLVTAVGCQRRSRDESERIQQELNTRTLRTDSLRQGIRYLSQTNPANKANLSKETRVLLNTWLKSADANQIEFTASKLLAGLDPRLLAAVGCESPEKGQFSSQDIDFLYQSRVARQLSDWIVSRQLHDRLLEPILEAKAAELQPTEAEKLIRAFKLFDWTIRNIKLAGVESSQVTVKSLDPRAPVVDGMVGVMNLPWQTALFCSGDFVERGRVFSALASQQGIDTCWISVGAAPGDAGHLFAIGILVGNELLLLEPKMGMPVLDPETDRWATLQDASNNELVLRRLNLPQYQYAFDRSSIKSVQLLIDAVPFSASLRAKLLETSLTGEERMVVSVDLDATAERLSRVVPNAAVAMWHAPLLAQVHAENLRERLGQLTEFSMRYMAEHAIWLLENPVSDARLQHLAGKFEKTLDSQGALKTYMETRVDEESLKKLAYNPDVQRAFGLGRGDNETREQFEARLFQAQSWFSRAKFDAAYLLAQLHFDRGDYSSCVYWLEKRVLNDPRSQRWHAPGWYLLARGHFELEKYDEAEAALIEPSIDGNAELPSYVINPQDAGNRLRLRMIRRLRAQGEPSESVNGFEKSD